MNATNPPQYSIDDVLKELVTGFAYKWNKEGEWWGHDTNLGNMDEMFIQAHDKLNQLIYTQVLELIDSVPSQFDYEEEGGEYQCISKDELRAKAKAKYIGGSDE